MPEAADCIFFSESPAQESNPCAISPQPSILPRQLRHRQYALLYFGEDRIRQTGHFRSHIENDRPQFRNKNHNVKTIAESI